MMSAMRALSQILRFFFRLLYNEFAFTYDWVSAFVSMGQWRSWQRAALPHLRGQRVLEIAHGTGNLLMDLRAIGFTPVGMDLSSAMGKIARRKIHARGLAGSIPLTRARVQALPFASRAFDSLLSTFPTEFIVDPAALAEFWRVLRPGGVLVCVPAAHITGLGLPDRFAEWLFRITGQSNSEWYQPLLKHFERAGFTARLERVALPRSVALVLIAEKTEVRNLTSDL